MEGEKKPDILFRSFFNLLILYVHVHVYTAHENLWKRWISVYVYTKKQGTNSCTDKFSLEFFFGSVRAALSLAAWEWDALCHGCCSPSQVPRRWLTPEFGTSGAARRTAQTLFFVLGDWAEQNCLKAPKKSFSPSKTGKSSAFPVPYTSTSIQ